MRQEHSAESANISEFKIFYSFTEKPEKSGKLSESGVESSVSRKMSHQERGGCCLEWRIAASLFSLFVIAAGAGWTDLRSGKVKNGCILLGLILGIVLRGWRFFPGAFPFALAGFFLFRFRMMGAGDGKLASLIGGYLGIWQGICAVGLGLLFASLWAVWKLAGAGEGRAGCAARFFRLFRYVKTVMRTGQIEPYVEFEQMSRQEKIPLGACLAAGVFVYGAICYLGNLKI